MTSFGASASSPAIEFQQDDMDKYLQWLQSYTFVQEQGFDPLMRDCKGIWENTTKREWTKFCLPAEDPLIIPVSFVKVRGVNVLVTEISICQIYDAPYYYRNYLYKIDLKEFRNIDIEEILRLLTRRKEI
ncbi:hypothetical protein Gotri_001319 [Gossypium trilobum]|uniref:Uncharacterized protein n=1 Tax=Gossypium trilobum TaxID=34281 RepID=A0A7J9FEA4_9ROSI|nr:hypothetical protein [Gossypium trilobum]